MFNKKPFSIEKIIDETLVILCNENDHRIITFDNPIKTLIIDESDKRLKEAYMQYHRVHIFNFAKYWAVLKGNNIDNKYNDIMVLDMEEEFSTRDFDDVQQGELIRRVRNNKNFRQSIIVAESSGRLLEKRYSGPVLSGTNFEPRLRLYKELNRGIKRFEREKDGVLKYDPMFADVLAISIKKALDYETFIRIGVEAEAGANNVKIEPKEIEL